MNKELLLVKNLKLILIKRQTNIIIQDSSELLLKYILDIYKISMNTLYYNIKHLNIKFF